MDSTLVESPKDFMDGSVPNFSYDPLFGIDYMHGSQPIQVSSLGLQGHASSPRLSFESLNMSNMEPYAFPVNPSYTTSSPGRPYTPPDNAGIYPAALSGPSAGELSSDSMSHRRRGSGTASPASSAHGGLSAVPRSHRFNPLGSAPIPTRAIRERKKRAKTEEYGSDDDDDVEFTPSSLPVGSDMSIERRREEIRKQRIESEQRRRDELRDGYRRLKDALPVSNQKSSKVCLLDRATTHIKYLEMTNQQLQTRVQQAEAEVQRLRQFNEALMLGTAEQRHAAAVASAAAATGVQQPNGY